VLIARPYGLLGREQVHCAQRRRARRAAASGDNFHEDRRPHSFSSSSICLPLIAKNSPYTLVLGIDVLIAVLFATSLHFIMGPGGMHSFGHAAYFGLGCLRRSAAGEMVCGADGASHWLAAPVLALVGALLFGWFAVRLSGVYLAMLTLAFAQIVWAAVFQWETLTGGSNGVLGVWPSAPFDSRPMHSIILTLALAALGVLLLRQIPVRAIRLRDAGRA
jgi:ABC-type branched-subunit amino acid transport system permease subunit